MFRIDRSSVDISADMAKINIAHVVQEAPVVREPLADASENPEDMAESILQEQEPQGITAEQAEQQAQQIIQDAQAQAQQIIQQAEQQTQDIHDASAREGYEAGKKEAMDISESKTREQVEQFSAMTKSMLDEFNKMTLQGNTQAVKLALSIAEKIIGFELDRNDFAYLSIAQQTLERIKGKNQLKMRVNPEDYQRFFASGATLEGLPGDVELEIVDDSRVPKGGCIVETDTESVNSGVDKQLEKVAQGFDLDGGGSV